MPLNNHNYKPLASFSLWRTPRFANTFFFPGPLLYHFADVANEWSVELPYEDIKRITTECFKMEIIVSCTQLLIFFS